MKLPLRPEMFTLRLALAVYNFFRRKNKRGVIFFTPLFISEDKFKFNRF